LRNSSSVLQFLKITKISNIFFQNASLAWFSGTMFFRCGYVSWEKIWHCPKRQNNNNAGS
jgi:hypothetical protein